MMPDRLLGGVRAPKRSKPACENLLRLACYWVATHEAIGNLLMAEEPEAVAQVRAVLRPVPTPLLGTADRRAS